MLIEKRVDLSRMTEKQKRDTATETSVLKNLTHPYIIAYRESYLNVKNELCIVMDYAEGGDLYAKIRRQRKVTKKFFPEFDIIRWFTQICLAVQHITRFFYNWTHFFYFLAHFKGFFDFFSFFESRL